MTPVILAFDTSGPWCVADILHGDTILASRADPMAKGQAEALMPLLQNLLAEAGLSMADLTTIAVGTGPGNFTGVRIAVSAARGLALGLGKPAIGVSRFQSEAGPLANGPLAISLRGPRDQAHVQLLHGLTPQGPAQIVAPNGSPDLPKHTRIAGILGPAPYDPDDMYNDLACRIARIAALWTGTPQPRPAPFYIRAADAAPPRDPAPVLLP